MYTKLPVDDSWLKACTIEGGTAEILHVVYLIIHIVIANMLSWHGHETQDSKLHNPLKNHATSFFFSSQKNC
jgi:hypothetical protein